MGTLSGSVGFPGSVAELLVEVPMKLAQARGEKMKSLLTDDRRRSNSVGRRSADKEYLASRAMPAGAATCELSRGLGWLACRASEGVQREPTLLQVAAAPARARQAGGDRPEAAARSPQQHPLLAAGNGWWLATGIRASKAAQHTLQQRQKRSAETQQKPQAAAAAGPAGLARTKVGGRRKRGRVGCPYQGLACRSLDE
jgi:hypothetical protein